MTAARDVAKSYGQPSPKKKNKLPRATLRMNSMHIKNRNHHHNQLHENHRHAIYIDNHIIGIYINLPTASLGRYNEKLQAQLYANYMS